MTAPGDEDGQLLLPWLVRLRWLAVVGQIAAVLTSAYLLGVAVAVSATLAVVGATLVTNLALAAWPKARPVPRGLLPGVVLLDVLLLTAMLGLTGGPANPFAVLYALHAAIATVALAGRWAWAVAALGSLCLLALLKFRQPLAASERAREVGLWLAVTLVAFLIVYFVGRVRQVLAQRERELIDARERARRSERFASLTALAAGAAHELGSPLGTIAVVAKEVELEASKLAGHDGMTEDARLIRTEVDRCRSILQRMRLDVGDDLMHRAGPVDVGEFVERASADLDDERRALLRVERVPRHLTSVHLPSRTVQRAVGILLRNAFDASKAGQPVTLRVDASKAGTVAFEVQDEGTGMPPEVLKRAGEPFFTTKTMGHGMGMGLFLVKLVAEQQGGTLNLTSASERGTKARLELGAPK